MAETEGNIADVPPMDSLPAAPRTVRLRPQAHRLVLIFRLGSLPFVAAAIFLIFTIIKSPLTFLLGKDTLGRIEEVQPYWRATGGRHFDITFTYDVESPKTGYGTIDIGGGPPPTVGSMLPIRALTLGPFHQAELRNGDGNAFALIIAGLFGCVWCGFVVLFTAKVWVGPIFDRRLVRYGDFAVGIVSGKKEKGSGRYHFRAIAYRFQALDGVKRLRLALVSAELFERLQVNQSVLVMYWPLNPARSRLYETSYYEVVSTPQK